MNSQTIPVDPSGQSAATQPIPTNEKEAINLGRGGHWASPETPADLAHHQNRAAAAYHTARGENIPAFPPAEHFGNNINWNNAISGSRANAVDLSLDDLRRQGVYTTSNAEKP